MGQTDLPPNWKVIKFGEAFTFTKKPQNLRYSEFERIPFVPMELIPVGSLFFDKFILKMPDELTSGTYFEPGDVLLAKITPSFENGKQGIIPSLPTPFGIASTEIIPIQEAAGISDKLYLFYYLLRNDVRSDLAGKMEGSTGRQRLNKSTLANLQIPLPSLIEQRAITYALRTVQKAIEVRRQEIALERERKAALMQHLFSYGIDAKKATTRKTKFGIVPEHWQTIPLEKCAYVQTGVAKGRKLKGGRTVTLPYLRVANVQDGYLNLTEMKEITIRASEVKRYSLQPGDVVMTEGGDFDKLGRGFIWNGQVSNCIHQNHIFAVRVNREVLLPEYFAYLIQSDYGKAYFLSVAHKTTNLASINSTKLKAFPTLVPELSVQRLIIEIIKAADSKIIALEREAEILDELFQAILEELMTERLSAVPLIDEVSV